MIPNTPNPPKTAANTLYKRPAPSGPVINTYIQTSTEHTPQITPQTIKTSSSFIFPPLLQLGCTTSLLSYRFLGRLRHYRT